MSNPLMQMAGMLRQGRNIMPMFAQMSGGDPRVGQFMQMMQGRSAQDMRQMAFNMARERGVDLSRLAQMYGLNLPK